MSENIKQGDSFSWVHILERDNGNPIDLRLATSVYAIAVLDGETTPTINRECEILNAEEGYVDLKLSTTDTATAGMYKLKFKCNFESDILTVPSSGTLWLHIEESYQEE